LRILVITRQMPPDSIAPAHKGGGTDTFMRTLFALAARRGIRAAALLTVTDLLLGERVRIAPDQLAKAEERMGELAMRALA